jgi:hypothetical protein
MLNYVFCFVNSISFQLYTIYKQISTPTLQMAVYSERADVDVLISLQILYWRIKQSSPFRVRLSALISISHSLALLAVIITVSV